MTQPVRLPVRKIVEQIMITGDIDSRFVDASAMQDGARAHRMLQQAMGEGYQKEVSLKLSAQIDDMPVEVFGRADGVVVGEDAGILVDEIKTTTMPLERFFQLRDLHLAQAKCYAYMLLAGAENGPETARVQLTYYQMETAEIARHVFDFTKAELEAFFFDLLRAYGEWLRLARDWHAARDASIKLLTFPYAGYRKGQREMAVAVYSAIEKRKRLYIQAPTGIGKTMSALFPSIKAMGEGRAEKLFYLTAKTVTRAVAEDAVRLLANGGLRLKTVTLRAKEKICFLDEASCNPDDCRYARNYYAKVNDALKALLNENDCITPDIIRAYAEQHVVCPHEFSLLAAEWADLVIGDYNHVFDPVVYLHRFFAEGGGEYVFLIDEAHNLCDRVRDMYTASLGKAAFDSARRGLKEKTAIVKRLKRALSAVSKYMQETANAQSGEARTSKELDTQLVEHARGFLKEAQPWLQQEQRTGHPMHHELLALYFEARAFVNIAAGYGEHYASITETYGKERLFTLYCLDPTGVISKKLEYARAAALFSATLTPLPYHREVLGGCETDGMLALSSPFESERMLLLAHHGISTKYADRQGSVLPLCEAIFEAVSHKRGNYLVYFPSFEYLREVSGAFLAAYPAMQTLVQDSAMDEESRAAFLARFAAENEETLVGFCVLGGIFSEGIDLVGERLIGSVVVGVGLPRISLRQELIRAYYDEKNGEGFAYAYLFPGMNKVLQAAGRVIRSEADYGMVLLIDSRFSTARYHALYPAHWAHMRMIRSKEELTAQLEGFSYFRA